MSTATKLHTPLLDKYLGGFKNSSPRYQSSPGLTIEKCVLFLASECDGAVLLDHKGFSSIDAPRGHEIAAKIAEGMGLSRSERRECLHYMTEYRGQLVRKFGGQAFDSVVRRKAFDFPQSNMAEQSRMPYLAYHEGAEKAVLTLPHVPKNDRYGFEQELQAMARANGPWVRSATDLGREYWPLDWESPRVAFRMSDSGMNTLVASLERRGVLVDERIRLALQTDVAATLWAKTYVVGKDKANRFPILFGVLQAKQDLDVRKLAEGFVSTLGIKNVYVDWDADKKIARFPIGNIMKEPLASFCTANRIAGIKDVIKAIDDPTNSNAQRRELRGQMDYAPIFPKPPMR